MCMPILKSAMKCWQNCRLNNQARQTKADQTKATKTKAAQKAALYPYSLLNY